MATQKQNEAHIEVIDLDNHFEMLRTHIVENPPDFGAGDPVLALLYEAYADFQQDG